MPQVSKTAVFEHWFSAQRDRLETEEDVAEYIAACVEEGGEDSAPMRSASWRALATWRNSHATRE
jgi:DNA-binding phage protein